MGVGRGRLPRSVEAAARADGAAHRELCAPSSGLGDLPSGVTFSPSLSLRALPWAGLPRPRQGQLPLVRARERLGPPGRSRALPKATSFGTFGPGRSVGALSGDTGLGLGPRFCRPLRPKERGGSSLRVSRNKQLKRTKVFKICNNNRAGDRGDAAGAETAPLPSGWWPSAVCPPRRWDRGRAPCGAGRPRPV